MLDEAVALHRGETGHEPTDEELHETGIDPEDDTTGDDELPDFMQYLGRHTVSGKEVVKVLVNAGGFEWRRTVDDHAQLYYEHPTNEDDRRQVTVPLHDGLRTGTLRNIAESAGANDFTPFCAWIDRNA